MICLQLTEDVKAMKVIACLDDQGGMIFNNRRQSKDRALNADVVNMAQSTRLLISPFSQKLFEGADVDLVCRGDFLDIAQAEDYCFVENDPILPYIDRIDEFIIYRWNRMYPTDIFFDVDFDKNGFVSVSVEEFEGHSHEVITKEIFRR